MVAVEKLAYESRVVREALEVLWEEDLPRVIADPFFSDAQHSEMLRRLPYYVAEIAVLFIAAFQKREAQYSARHVFTRRGARPRRLFALLRPRQ